MLLLSVKSYNMYDLMTFEHSKLQAKQENIVNIVTMNYFDTYFIKFIIFFQINI
jgi:hypothetical protein